MADDEDDADTKHEPENVPSSGTDDPSGGPDDATTGDAASSDHAETVAEEDAEPTDEARPDDGGSSEPERLDLDIVADGLDVRVVEQAEPAAAEPKLGFPVVGVGASAGGYEAVTTLLEALPQSPGIAFVVVQHLDPTHESQLASLLARRTKLRVAEARDGVKIKRDHVYVIPPKSQLALRDGALWLKPRESGPGHQNVIDRFFRSLANVQGNRAIGVILSGTLSDGVTGMAEIKAAGGFTFAQDAATAKYPEMPSNAIAAGHVDFVLPPEEIAKELSRLGKHPYVLTKEGDLPPRDSIGGEEAKLQEIFRIVRGRTGVDFSNYKRSTLKRRIHRRTMANRMETLNDYVEFLRKHPEEADALHEEILITVTRFFRDEEAYPALRETVFPRVFENKADDEPLRIWVPACATGEEAFSMAIGALEYMREHGLSNPLQVFGTDISDRSIERARAGRYGENIVEDVGPDVLRRYFTQVEGGYEVNKTVRGLCVFAVQDLVRDPPFSNIDIVSCRNLLIYLQPALQRRVITTLHYSLRAPGFLILGRSESIKGSDALFEQVEVEQRIYLKKQIVPAPLLHDILAPPSRISEDPTAAAEVGASAWSENDVVREADRIAIERYVPPAIVVTEDLNIIQFRGKTGRYLEHTPGLASLNVMKMARPGLEMAIRSGVQEAKNERSSVRRDGVQYTADGRQEAVDIEIVPMRGPSKDDRYYMVLFVGPSKDAQRREARTPRERRGFWAWFTGADTSEQGPNDETERLKRDLAATRDYLQSVVEEYEATTEELRSANEEALSSNEELQSTNEELETAKEELQSTNEELTTLNDELHKRNQEVQKVNNDLLNLLNSVNIPIVMLGDDLTIRRWTPQAEEMMNLIPTDMGRPLTDINHGLDIPDLRAEIESVLSSLQVEQLKVTNEDGDEFLLNIHPYRTSDNSIEGAVLVLLSAAQVAATGDGQ